MTFEQVPPLHILRKAKAGESCLNCPPHREARRLGVAASGAGTFGPTRGKTAHDVEKTPQAAIASLHH
jgi:hypothetical protein